MNKFTERVKDLRDRAALNITDLALFCEVNKNTMWTWLNGRMPFPARMNLLSDRLDLIELAIKRKLFPVPLSITQYQRQDYIKDTRDAVLGRVLKPRPPGGKLSVRGVNKSKKQGDKS